jgi:hypothetical protein
MAALHDQPLLLWFVNSMAEESSGAASNITHIGNIRRLGNAFTTFLLQIGPEQAVCNMLNAVKGWTGILVFAAAIAIGFALILRGLAPEFSNQFQGAIRSVIVGLIIIAVLPLVATFILTSLGASGTGDGCAS